MTCSVANKATPHLMASRLFWNLKLSNWRKCLGDSFTFPLTAIIHIEEKYLQNVFFLLRYACLQFEFYLRLQSDGIFRITKIFFINGCFKHILSENENGWVARLQIVKREYSGELERYSSLNKIYWPIFHIFAIH